MRKAIAFCLAVLCAFSALTVSVSAAQTQKIHVYDLLKYDADGRTGTCRTIEIYFENQYTNFDSAKSVTFQKADGTVVAECVPKSDNNRRFDLYTPEGAFGVVLNPTYLYYLVIPEGAYYTDDGILNAAYRGEYNGIYLSDTDRTYSKSDLGIIKFLVSKASEGRLYDGKLLFSTAFSTTVNGKDSILLFKIVDGSETLVGTYSVTACKAGQADIDFCGTEIDRWAQYRLHVQYGTFLAGGTVINDHSDFAISGKKLLGLSGHYPVIDLLLKWFGAEHWTLKAVKLALKALVFVKLVSQALYNDIEKYIGAGK